MIEKKRVCLDFTSNSDLRLDKGPAELAKHCIVGMEYNWRSPILYRLYTIIGAHITTGFTRTTNIFHSPIENFMLPTIPLPAISHTARLLSL